jgi:2-isopropylmalate synthase
MTRGLLRIQEMRKMIELYDTTLREGSQNADISFSRFEKFRIIEALDSFGMDYIELGWPGSSAGAFDFIKEAASMRLKNSQLVSFGSTKRKGIRPEDDPNIKALLECGTSISCIFGKVWLEHVGLQLRVAPEENLRLISESVSYLKKHGQRVFFDAEHFFDGFLHDKAYAFKTIDAAVDAGAESIVLCDTNGGMLPDQIKEITAEVKEHLKRKKINLGIHCHNDSGCAVANTISACSAGATHLQGTINGLGERTGNADLCSVIPNIKIKLGHPLSQDMRMLTELSHKIYEYSSMRKNPAQPYVGKNAFSHKGGVHVDALSKGASYEHIVPADVGNKRRIILSDLSGKANIFQILKDFNISANKDDPSIKKLLAEIKRMESEGYDMNDLDAEKELLINRFFGQGKDLFRVSGWRIHCENDPSEYSECIVFGTVLGKRKEVVSSVRGGPVEAIFNALKKLVSDSFSIIDAVRLFDYKVMIARNMGAESTVRVLIRFRNSSLEWSTVGVSKNILNASFEAVEKGFRYYLMKDHWD